MPQYPFFQPWMAHPGAVPLGLGQSPAQFLQAIESGLPLARHVPDRRVPTLDRFQELDEDTLRRHSGRHQRPPGQASYHQGPVPDRQPSFSALAGRFATADADTTRD